MNTNCNDEMMVQLLMNNKKIKTGDIPKDFRAPHSNEQDILRKTLSIFENDIRHDNRITENLNNFVDVLNKYLKMAVEDFSSQ